MPDALAAPSPADPARRARRRRRVERELRALHALERRHLTRDALSAALAVPLLAALTLVVFLKLEWLSGSLPAAIGLSLLLGLAIWWIGRRWIVLAGLILMGLSIVALEEPSVDLPGMSDDREARTRARLEAALARREALLRELDA